MEVIVFIILKIFFATCAVLKIGEYSWIFPSFSWGIVGHMTRLDQLCVSANISWIMMYDNSANQIAALTLVYKENSANVAYLSLCFFV